MRATERLRRMAKPLPVVYTGTIRPQIYNTRYGTYTPVLTTRVLDRAAVCTVHGLDNLLVTSRFLRRRYAACGLVRLSESMASTQDPRRYSYQNLTSLPTSDAAFKRVRAVDIPIAVFFPPILPMFPVRWISTIKSVQPILSKLSILSIVRYLYCQYER